jgi:acyl carrier protein
MMESFLEELVGVFEIDVVDPSLQYKDIDEWDSLTALTLLTCVEDNYSVDLDEDDLDATVQSRNSMY